MTVQLRKQNRRVLFWVGGLAVVGIMVSAAFIWQRQQQSASFLSGQQTAIVERQALAAEILAGGVVQAERSTNLSPEGSGKIAALFIQEGDRVTQGQIIARMVNRRHRHHTRNALRAQSTDGTRSVH